MSSSGPKTTVIRNGTLIDGTGKPARRNEAIVIDGNRIKSVGALPPEITLDDHRNPWKPAVILTIANGGFQFVETVAP